MNEREGLEMSAPYYPEELWSEILPGLFQGGTDEADELGGFLRAAPTGLRSWEAIDFIQETQLTTNDFDTVITAYNQANPCSLKVKELRFTFFDGNMTDFDPEQDLYWLVREAHSDWKAGKKVLVRCQAGINRSGLITALVLIRDGHEPAAAIELIRQKRCTSALSNSHFEQWLLNNVDLDFWRN